MILLFLLLVYEIWTYRFSAANRGQYGVPKYYLPLVFQTFHSLCKGFGLQVILVQLLDTLITIQTLEGKKQL